MILEETSAASRSVTLVIVGSLSTSSFRWASKSVSPLVSRRFLDFTPKRASLPPKLARFSRKRAFFFALSPAHSSQDEWNLLSFAQGFLVEHQGSGWSNRYPPHGTRRIHEHSAAACKARHHLHQARFALSTARCPADKVKASSSSYLLGLPCASPHLREKKPPLFLHSYFPFEDSTWKNPALTALPSCLGIEIALSSIRKISCEVDAQFAVNPGTRNQEVSILFFRWFLSGSLLFVSIFCWSCSTTSSRSNSRSKPAQEAFSSKQRKLPQRLAIRYLERSMGRFVLARAVQPKVPKSTSPFPLRARENWVRLLREIRPLVGSLPAYRLKLLQRKLRREKERDRLHYSVFPEHLERDIEALYTNSQRQILASKEAALLAYRRALRAQSSAEKAMEKALLDSLHHHHAPSHSHRHKVRRARRRYRSRRSKQTRRFYRSLRLLFPVPGYRIGSGYGWRSDPFTRRRRFHGAVDIGAPRGTPILAVASGTVTGARWMGSCGRAVLIRHRNLRYRRVYSGYCHMYRIKVRRGQRVRRGQLIGLVGSTGRSTAPHLHFFLRIHRRTVNPANHFR